MNAPEVDADQAKELFDSTYKALTMAGLLKIAAKDTFDTPSEADAFRGGRAGGGANRTLAGGAV